MHEMATIWQVRFQPTKNSQLITIDSPLYTEIFHLNIRFSSFSVYSSLRNHYFGPVLAWLAWKISNLKALNHTHGFGAF